MVEPNSRRTRRCTRPPTALRFARASLHFGLPAAGELSRCAVALASMSPQQFAILAMRSRRGRCQMIMLSAVVFVILLGAHPLFLKQRMSYFQTRMFPAAWRILREFGGISVEAKRNLYSFREQKETFIFNPLEAVERTQAYNWPFSEWEADGSLYPIGYLDTGTTDNSAVAVDGRGQIIMIEFDKLIGSNIDEALNNIINFVPLKDWEVEEWKIREAADIFPIMRERLGLK